MAFTLMVIAAAIGFVCALAAVADVQSKNEKYWRKHRSSHLTKGW